MPKSATARYEILVPKTDDYGQPLQELASVVIRYASGQIDVPYAHTETRSVFMDGQSKPYDAVIIQAADNPQSDSIMRQLGVFVGEIANCESVLVSKHGSQGIQSWPIRNPTYQESTSPVPPVPAPTTPGPGTNDISISNAPVAASNTF